MYHHHIYKKNSLLSCHRLIFNYQQKKTNEFNQQTKNLLGRNVFFFLRRIQSIFGHLSIYTKKNRIANRNQLKQHQICVFFLNKTYHAKK